MGRKLVNEKRLVVKNKIAGELKKLQKESIFFVEDFLDFGNSESVKKALFRLLESPPTAFFPYTIFYNPNPT